MPHKNTPGNPATADTGTDSAAQAFIHRWKGVTASELSTSQSFVIQLCELLGVEAPHPTPEQSYMFERPITFQHGDGSTSAGRVDCYKRGHFVWESKKLKLGKTAGVQAQQTPDTPPVTTKAFDDALLRARTQAENYARALPAAEGRPPFVVVVDVGHVIELYAEFTRSGATYTPFPDPRSHRIRLEQLAQPAVRARLKALWTDPLSLDPSRISAKVTLASNTDPQANPGDFVLVDAKAGQHYSIQLPANLFSDTDGDTLTWTILKREENRYEGRETLIDGVAEGEQAGSAFRWQYARDVPDADGAKTRFGFDDWFILHDDKHMSVHASLTKLGVEVATLEALLRLTAYTRVEPSVAEARDAAATTESKDVADKLIAKPTATPAII